MSSTNGRRRRRSTLPVDDLVASYTRRRTYTSLQPDTAMPSTSVTLSLSNYVDCGDCDLVCSYCGALFWLAERAVSQSRKGNPVYTRCCKVGKVVLPAPQCTPPELLSLYGDRPFRDNIRAYNALFAMTSFGAKIDDTINDGFGPYTFKVSGQISHWIGTLCPDPDVGPRFLQFYIYDSSNEVHNRLRVCNASIDSRLRPDVVAILSKILGSVNKYVRVFKNAKQVAGERDLDEYAVRLYSNVALQSTGM